MAGDRALLPEVVVPQAEFDDLYSAVYAVIDDAKGDHDLVKLYKGSHGSAQPHPMVSDFGEFFFAERRGLIGYACHQATTAARLEMSDLEAFDATFLPRIRMGAAFELLRRQLQRPGETTEDVLNYVASRVHPLGAYRGGSSGFDEEARAVAAQHFRQQRVPSAPEEVLVFGGGAKGVFLAFCAAVMCHRDHDELKHHGGIMLAPEGYYQSLRLIPAVFGGAIDVVPELTGDAVRDWLYRTRGIRGRAVYVPLINNADGRVLDHSRAWGIARAVLEHNQTRPAGGPVFILADDVYTDSVLSGRPDATPIASLRRHELGDPSLGDAADWVVTVVTSSKTFALPTSRVAFATTTNPALREALVHYRSVFSHGRVSQAAELTAAAAICLTPQAWITMWNQQYRSRLHELAEHIAAINTRLGFEALRVRQPEGGWYLPFQISRRLLPGAASNVDACAVLLHYGGPDTGIAMLPGALFGIADTGDYFTLRGTVAVPAPDLHRFIERLTDLTERLSLPDGEDIIQYAIKRARTVAPIDEILSRCRY